MCDVLGRRACGGASRCGQLIIDFTLQHQNSMQTQHARWITISLKTTKLYVSPLPRREAVPCPVYLNIFK